MNLFDYFHRQPIQPTSGVIVLSIPGYRADRAPRKIYRDLKTSFRVPRCGTITQVVACHRPFFAGVALFHHLRNRIDPAYRQSRQVVASIFWRPSEPVASEQSLLDGTVTYRMSQDSALQAVPTEAEADELIHVISVFRRLLSELVLNVTHFKLAIKKIAHLSRRIIQ